MTDYFGNEIHIGDKVICTGRYGNRLDINEIAKFTTRKKQEYNFCKKTTETIIEEYAVFKNNKRRQGYDLISLTALGYEYDDRAKGLIKLEEDNDRLPLR